MRILLHISHPIWSLHFAILPNPPTMPEHDLCLLALDGGSVRLILRRGGMTGGWKSHSLQPGAHVLMSLGCSFVVDNWIHESSLSSG
jgi:hypothetical protein